MDPTQSVKPSGPSAAKRGRLPTTQIAISAVMADGAARKPSEVARLLGLTPGAASAAMGRMARAGVLQKVGTGVYRQESVESLPGVAAVALDDKAQTQSSDAQTEPPIPDSPSLRQTRIATQQDGAPHDGSLRQEVGRAAFATKLWLKDAARFRFGDYHWEKRRRRMHDRDRKTGRANR
jgi:hypothetical protein